MNPTSLQSTSEYFVLDIKELLRDIDECLNTNEPGKDSLPEKEEDEEPGDPWELKEELEDANNTMIAYRTLIMEQREVIQKLKHLNTLYQLAIPQPLRDNLREHLEEDILLEQSDSIDSTLIDLGIEGLHEEDVRNNRI